MNNKLRNLQNYMKENNIDLIYQDDPNSVAYFTNFQTDPHERIVAYLVSQSDHFLFLPSLEENDARDHTKIENIYSYTDSENPWSIIRREAEKITDQINTIGIDRKTLTVDRYFKLEKYLGSEKSKDITSFVEQMRLIKSEDEIEKMLLAGELADEALKIGRNLLTKGISEQEVAATIDMEMKKRGVSGMSFSTLVLFGDHAASPHGTPGERQLKENELVLFDLGVLIDGYASDVTRMVVLGEATEREKELYSIVLDAKETAQAAVKPGIRAGDLDKIARDIIKEAGYGEYFTHRLGHGIGKTAHEYPSIHDANDIILEEGMCFSIEPGIYIENDLGIRFEDCVYVTEDSCVPFTKTGNKLQRV
ncbi:MAG: Xaa-Pro peptidase family protein [Atopostipes sp.]|nr:Xaa-Pro peptidase family protein [Atopostipes sp.]